jgi:alkanesulfonate monooxygenase SsuD/methylene tetrahydromethanopterin reductase-like flavin-dependent oxidoreductase (luciferase family)
MKRGISIPNFGSYADVRETARLAARAEAGGFDGFFVWDHIHNTGWAPGGPPAPLRAADPWILLAGIALATETIRIGPMVTPLPRRRPWKVARETVTLDHLSGGRLTLGVGLGFPADDEYERFGEPHGDVERAELLDEGLEVLTKLWSGEQVSFAGKRYQVDGVQFLPRPMQEPRIPVWCAGMWPGTGPFRRAARWDGVFPIGNWPNALGPDDVRDICATIERHRGSLEGYDIVIPAPFEAGRDEEFAAAGTTWLVYSPYTREDLEELLRGSVTGRPA